MTMGRLCVLAVLVFALGVVLALIGQASAQVPSDVFDCTFIPVLLVGDGVYVAPDRFPVPREVPECQRDVNGEDLVWTTPMPTATVVDE